MLVLSRRIGQRIKIGNEIVITIVRCGADVVRVGVDAPKRLAVLREELLEREAEPETSPLRESAA